MDTNKIRKICLYLMLKNKVILVYSDKLIPLKLILMTLFYSYSNKRFNQQLLNEVIDYEYNPSRIQLSIENKMLKFCL